MKSIKQALWLVLLVNLNISCSDEIIVDCLYPSVTIGFEIIDASEDVKVEHYRDRRFVQVFNENDSYCIATGKMRGGYTLVGEEKVNVHDPVHYKIIRIDWPGVGRRDLSVHDIESLSFNELEGQKIFQLTQIAFLEVQSQNMIDYPKIEIAKEDNKPKSGVYLCNMVYVERDGIATGKKVDVVVYGKQVRIVAVEGSSPGLVRLGEIIEEGELIQDAQGNWIIKGSEINDLPSNETEECSGRPSVIDFVNKRYIKC